MNLDENLENAELEPNQPTRREWGSIRQRGSNSWEIRYPTLRSSGIPGKHSYETVQGSREDAEKVLERRRADYDWKKRCIEDEQERIIVATTKDGEGSRTVDDIWTHSYLPYARERIEEGSMQKSTLHGYKHYYTLHVGPVFGHRPIGSILHSEVQRYYKTLTNPQAKHTLAIMRILWNFACTEEGGRALLKSHNIMLESFKMPPASKKKIKVVSSIYDKEELQEVLEAIEGDPIEPYILLMGGGGARPGEACGVWKQEIQFDYHNHPLSGEGQFWAVVPLNRTVGRVDGEIIIKSTLKTETSRRSLFIPEPYSIRLKELVDTVSAGLN